MEMTKVSYSSTSQYYSTGQSSWHLDLWKKPSIPLDDNSDYMYSITTKYDNNPGLLAYELYGDQKLWWVFVIMNPDILIDPIYDFVSGIQIRVPTKTRLQSCLG